MRYWRVGYSSSARYAFNTREVVLENEVYVPHFYPKQGEFGLDEAVFEYGEDNELEGRKDTDFINIGFQSLLAVKTECMAGLIEMFRSHGTIVSNQVGTQGIKIFRCQIELDVFDYGLSDYALSDTQPKTVRDLRQVFMKAPVREDIHMFRLSGDIALRRTLIISDKFRDLVVTHELSGLKFSEVKSII